MEITKSHWQTEADSMRLNMPIAKVDESKRLVSGFATLDNLDSQGDIVLSEASLKAFQRFRGAIREMHQPIAAGKLVDFREEEFFHVDPATGESKFYRGIFVTAYVSKGAEATWEKVLDGTLTGFSIGGNILEADNEFNKESGATVRFIKDYELIELSLVDNPANQLANVFSITKSANGSVTVKGMAVDTEIENVFYCKEHPQAIKATGDESAVCIECDSKMENIGWFETGGDRAEKVRDVVNKFLGLTDANAADDEGEGGVNVSENVEKSETPDEVTETETPNAEEAGNEVPQVTPEPEDRPEATDADAAQVADVEEDAVEPVDEVTDDSEQISKKIDELHVAVNNSLEQTRNETTEKVAALESKIAEINESFTQKASELESKFNEFGDKLEAAKSKLAEFEKSLEVVNSSEAVKKSGDLESPEPVQKSATWNGAFSVDNLLR